MSAPIGDAAAIAFAAEFYQALALGKSVQDAFDLGVVRLLGEEVAEAKGRVKLHKRRGFKPSEAVLVGTKPEPGAQGEPIGQEGRTTLAPTGIPPESTLANPW